MKKYIQPESTVVCFHVEGTLMATSAFGANQEAAKGEALSNKKTDMWGHKDMWD